MAYFIFTHLNNFYKIAENSTELNQLNLNDQYKIIEDSIENFNAVRLGIKLPVKLDNNKKPKHKPSKQYNKT